MGAKGRASAGFLAVVAGATVGMSTLVAGGPERLRRSRHRASSPRVSEEPSPRQRDSSTALPPTAECGLGPTATCGSDKARSAASPSPRHPPPSKSTVRTCAGAHMRLAAELAMRVLAASGVTLFYAFWRRAATSRSGPVWPRVTDHVIWSCF